MATSIYGPRPSRRRRHPAQTPTFIEEQPVPETIPLPSPVLLGGPGGEPIPTPPSVQGTSGSWWSNLINNPQLATFAAGAAQRLLAPPSFGQTPTSQIVGGLLGGAGDVQTARMIQAQQAAAARAEGREERKVEISETAEERQGREQRSVANAREQNLGYEGQRVGLEGRRVAVAEEGNALERERMTEASRKWEQEHKLAERRAQIAEKRAGIEQQRLNQLVRDQAEQRDIDNARVAVQRSTVEVARQRLNFDKTEANRKAAQAGDQFELNLNEIAFQQAGREVDALAKAYASPEEILTHLRTRVDQIKSQLRKTISPQSVAPSGETPNTPVKPAEPQNTTSTKPSVNNPPSAPSGTEIEFAEYPGVKFISDGKQWKRKA